VFKFNGLKEYIIVSTVIARVFSAVFNYAVNYKKVFLSNETVAKSATKYFCLAILQMGCSALFVTLGVMATTGNEVVVKIIVDTILFFISYKIQHRLVFAKRK